GRKGNMIGKPKGRRPGIATLIAAAVLTFGLAAQAQETPRPSGPPGLSPLDRSSRATSGQDQALRPHPTPPVATAPDKVPVGKLRLRAGFKAELWSHGHAGGRTMVRGAKGTIFMGSRRIGRVYAIIDKGRSREVKTVLKGLNQPNGLAFRDGALYVF